MRIISETTVSYDDVLMGAGYIGRTSYRYSSNGLLLRKETRSIFNKRGRVYLSQQASHALETLSVERFYYHKDIQDSAIKKTFFEDRQPKFTRRYADTTGLYQYAVFKDSIFVHYLYHLKTDKSEASDAFKIPDSTLATIGGHFAREHRELVNRSRAWIAKHHHESTPHDD